MCKKKDRAVKDGRLESLTREPEQVKAFRDTWKDGIHSYLTYLRDRLTVARDLLTESGSIFVQISDENVHRVRALLDEVFGEENFIAQINFKATSPLGQKGLAKVYDYIIWYSKSKPRVKIRNLFDTRDISDDREWRFNDSWENSDGYEKLNEEEFRKLKDLNGIFRRYKLTSSGYTPTCTFDFDLYGHNCSPHGRKSWVTNTDGIRRLTKANRLFRLGKSPYFKTYFRESRLTKYNNSWTDQPAAETRVYVVQTAEKFVQRCMLMTTDPGDIVFDPTCGSGTTAYVAEQWGRKWITTDTSRVALALARTRLMSARYPSYILADSEEGIRKEAEFSGKVGVSSARPRGDLRQGFVYERVPNISLGDIARNIEIDVIFDRYQKDLEELRSKYNSTLGTDFLEWEIPRDAVQSWPEEALAAHENWWKLRLARQAEIDKSIAQKADDELLYDRPYEDKSKVRVAGPFTVESLSPHRVVAMDDRDDILDPTLADEGQLKRSSVAPETDFAQVILENLRTHGVQQGAKEDRLEFTHLAAWPGELIAAEGHFNEGDKTRRAGILLGPEYGALTRTDITAAAREASDARFDVLIAVGFAFDAHTTGLNRLGPMNIIKAKMNPDLHMADDLKNTGKGNLFMVIGEPDIDIVEMADGQMQIKLHGMDVFVPATGEIRSGEKDDIAAWFIDTAYNEESFFVRHAYFLGGNDPYKSLKTSLKAEINKEAWESLKRDTSRPFKRPDTGRIAVKVINHFGDEVMKVFTV